MGNEEFADLSVWITEAGLAGQSESAILTGFCEREIARGVPLARALVLIDTLHPIYEGRAFRWTRAQKETTLIEYGRSDDDLSRWQRSPFRRLEESGESLLRRRLSAATEAEFSIFPELRAAGMTDYLAMANRFAGEEIIGRMDCVYSSWATDASQGFADDDIAHLRRLMPFLALAVKAASLARIAGTLVETYLGRDPGRRVLQGRIARGVAERIEAVLWFSDLRSYTRISDTASPEDIIPLLNQYADAIISAIHE
jgi:adenylate cyclase